MDLILWRHAEAEEGFPDAARRLTLKGGEQAQRMAVWLKGKLPGRVRIIASPTVRTQQTAQALCADFITDNVIGPSATVKAILDAANWPNAETAVLIIGHQPTIGEVVHHLIPVIPSGLRVKKGSVWWIRGESKEEFATSVLHAVVYPEDV
ncbi:MAG: histidine phosphatase family protein [Nitrosomonas sp.]|nr:MAG: histidine phosphatase family protein [Nitrosomonas sp.]